MLYKLCVPLQGLQLHSVMTTICSASCLSFPLKPLEIKIDSDILLQAFTIPVNVTIIRLSHEAKFRKSSLTPASVAHCPERLDSIARREAAPLRSSPDAAVPTPRFAPCPLWPFSSTQNQNEHLSNTRLSPPSLELLANLLFDEI